MGPNTDRGDLARRFRELADDALLERCRSGSLSEVAQAVAEAELASRGLALPEPPDAASEPAASEGDFVPVARFINPNDAHIVRAALEAAGLPAVAADFNTVQMIHFLAPAMGGVRILVPESRVREAREIIEALNRGEFALPDN